jgi:hypothetical protein
MADNLLEICQVVAREFLSYELQSIVGNQSPDAVLLRAFASQTCKELNRDYTWQALKRTYSITTVPGQAAYDLPSDYRSPISLTFWIDSTAEPIIVTGDREWKAIQSGLINSIQKRFLIEENKLKFIPVPASAQTISFNYYSNSFVEDIDGNPKKDFSLDSDICRFDGDMVARGIKFRFAANKGLPYSELKADYIAAIDSIQGSDKPKPIIDLSRKRHTLYANIPEGNFGI